MSNFGFCGRKAPPPFSMWEKLLTPDLSISGNFEQLWFVWQKSHPHPGWGKIFWHHIYQYQAISSRLWFLWQKSPAPATHPRMRGNFLTPDLSISGNFEQLWFCGRKVPPPPTPRMREIFLTPDLSNSGNSEQLWFLWQKSTPPPQGWGKIILTPDLSNSGNFEQLWFLWKKSSSPPTGWGKIFLTPDLSNSGNFEQLWFLWQKSPPPLPGWGKIFWHQIYPFQAILSNFGFCGRKASPPPTDEENFLTPDLSISGNFEKLWFLWQKSPPPLGWGKMLRHQIYPFQAISSNFGLCGRRASPLPPSTDEQNFFDTRSIQFRQFWATLVFVAEKPPPPPLPGWGKIFWHQIYPFQAILSNFGFCGRKAPPLPPRDEGNFFDTRSIHFRQFWASLVFVGEKPPPRMRENFLGTRSIHFRQFWVNFPSSLGGAFLPQKSELLEIVWNYSFQAIFEQLLFLWQKIPPPPLQHEGNYFWHQIYPIQAISSNFGFCGRKAPPPHHRMSENFLTPDLSNSGNFEQLWFLWQKSPPQDEGKFLDTRSIHFRQFQANLVLWQKISPPPQMRVLILTPDLSNSGNFE